MNARSRSAPRWLFRSALAVMAALALATVGDRPAGYWAPRGFVERADRIVSQGGLRLECGTLDSIVVDLAPGSSDERFFRSSYLRADVRRFNDDPTASRSPFLTDGCELRGVDPFHHRVDLPYNRIPRWTGSVRFATADRGASLLGGRDQRLEVMHPLDGVGVTRTARVDPERRDATARTEFLRLQAPRSREVAAEAFFVGGHPVLADRRDVGSPVALRLDGFLLPPGRVLRLRTGDWVQMEASGRIHTYLVQGSDRAGLISSRARAEGSARRYHVPHMRPFVRSLAQAFQAGLQTTPRARGDGSVSRTDVRLTANRELETATQEVLDGWCERLRLESRPRVASALVMDAFSGDVLAMPTCPGEAIADEYRRLSRRMRSRYVRNQNLATHPVGSALKPFWAAAVATAHPAMLDLEIPPHAGEVDEILGCDLAEPYRSIGHDRWEGLETFIRESCNRYMVEMATVALMAGSGRESCGEEDADVGRCLEDAGPDAGRPVRFCDRVVHLALTDGLPFTGRSCSDLRVVGTSFEASDALETLTGARTYRDPDFLLADRESPLDALYRAGRYRLDLWRGPIERLRAAGDTADATITALRFAAVSPEVTNLALNTVEDLRADWVNLLLGGENSRWSNLQLAEATARLVTGRDVRARLAADPGATPAQGDGARPAGDAAPPLDRDALHPGARRRVLHAMELVVGPEGTARRLGPLARALEEELRATPGAEGYELRVFAKTGTPATAAPTGARRAGRQGSVLVLGLLAVPEAAGRRASRRHPEWISACAASPELRDGVLGVPPVRLLNGDGALGGPRAFALSVAVYVDDLDPDAPGASATAVAEDLMGPIGEHLTQRIGRHLRQVGF